MTEVLARKRQIGRKPSLFHKEQCRLVKKACPNLPDNAVPTLVWPEIVAQMPTRVIDYLHIKELRHQPPHGEMWAEFDEYVTLMERKENVAQVSELQSAQNVVRRQQDSPVSHSQASQFRDTDHYTERANTGHRNSWEYQQSFPNNRYASRVMTQGHNREYYNPNYSRDRPTRYLPPNYVPEIRNAYQGQRFPAPTNFRTNYAPGARQTPSGSRYPVYNKFGSNFSRPGGTYQDQEVPFRCNQCGRTRYHHPTCHLK